jgi:16S rRNA (uracil1498-N3)-methyltransferase
VGRQAPPLTRRSPNLLLGDARFPRLCQPSVTDPKEIVLSPDESHHLVAVNRAAAGATVVAFDGKGSEWICELADADKRAAKLKVRFAQKAKPMPWRITLGQALPLGGAMDSIVRKATEIGVVPDRALGERADAGPPGRRPLRQEDRQVADGRARGREAVRQPWLPEIGPVTPASAFMEAAKGYDLKLIASLQPGAKSAQVRCWSSSARRRTAFPERPLAHRAGGRLHAGRDGLSRTSGFEPITLGPLVLRCETAAVYALSVLSYELTG